MSFQDFILSWTGRGLCLRQRWQRVFIPFTAHGAGWRGKNELCLKYGKSNLGGAFAQTDAPFDFIADLLRSFTGMMMDIRRVPDKVEAACEAILPLMVKAGAKGTPERRAAV